MNPWRGRWRVVRAVVNGEERELSRSEPKRPNPPIELRDAAGNVIGLVRNEADLVGTETKEKTC
jgi:hypothetical protein